MNLTPINYQVNLNQNKSIMFGNSPKLIKQGVKSITNDIEKVVLPAVGTVLATLGVAQVTSQKTQKDENFLDAKVTNYLDRIKASGDNTNEHLKILDDLEKEPYSLENEALRKVAFVAFMNKGVKDSSQLYEKILSEIVAEDNAKKEILKTINPNAKLNDAFFENVFKRYTGENKLSPEEKESCTELLKSNAGIVEKMMAYKNKDGSQMFPPEMIGEFFYNSRTVIENDPARIFMTLEGETFNKVFADYENKSYALWKCIYF